MSILSIMCKMVHRLSYRNLSAKQKGDFLGAECLNVDTVCAISFICTLPMEERSFSKQFRNLILQCGDIKGPVYSSFLVVLGSSSGDLSCAPEPVSQFKDRGSAYI